MLKRGFIAVFFLIFACSAYADECDNWQEQHPEWIWCDGFETEQDIAAVYDDYSTNGMSISSDDAFMGGYSLKQHYDAGQVDAGWISKFYCDALGGDYGPCYNEIYMRWYHKFEQGFEGIPPKMARITSIGPGWDKRFGVYYWVSQPDESPGYPIVADVEAYNGWLPIIKTDFLYSNPDNIGRWTCNEMRVKSGAGGGYTYWADGVKIAERNNTNLNGPYNFNNAMLDAYWNSGSPKSQDRYYDNLVISTKRIGCVGYDPGSAPDVQQCTDADADSSGDISNNELRAYIVRWKMGEIDAVSLLDAISKWKDGC